MKRVIAKLGNMRKEQDFTVYPTSDKGNVIVQSDKSIGSFDAKTGEGILNTKGCYFPHLNAVLGAKPFTFPTDFVVKCIANQYDEGELIGVSEICGAVYMGSVTEI